MKKSLFLLPFLVLFFSVPAFANVQNSNTGAESVNNASEVIENTVKITNKNTADVDNQIHVQVSTGGNEIERNTGGEEDDHMETIGANTITTGNAEANVTVSNNVNGSTITATLCCEKEEEKEEGQGEKPVVPPTSETSAGRGGGVQLAAAETPVVQAAETGAGFGGGELAEAGANPWVQMALLLGLPFAILYLIRRYEVKSGKLA